jgi:hypothetical protein
MQLHDHHSLSKSKYHPHLYCHHHPCRRLCPHIKIKGLIQSHYHRHWMLTRFSSQCCLRVITVQMITRFLILTLCIRFGLKCSHPPISQTWVLVFNEVQIRMHHCFYLLPRTSSSYTSYLIYSLQLPSTTHLGILPKRLSSFFYSQTKYSTMRPARSSIFLVDGLHAFS